MMSPEQLWQDYLSGCYGEAVKPGSVQYTEMRWAFLSGMFAAVGELGRVGVPMTGAGNLLAAQTARSLYWMLKSQPAATNAQVSGMEATVKSLEKMAQITPDSSSRIEQLRRAVGFGLANNKKNMIVDLEDLRILLGIDQ